MTPLSVLVEDVETQTPPAFNTVDHVNLRTPVVFGKRSAQQQRITPPVSVYSYDECVLWGKNGWEPTKCDEEEKHFICKFW